MMPLHCEAMMPRPTAMMWKSSSCPGFEPAKRESIASTKPAMDRIKGIIIVKRFILAAQSVDAPTSIMKVCRTKSRFGKGEINKEI
jgi:hypothetical protein